MPKEQDFRKQVRLVYHYLLLTFVSVVLIIFGVIYITTEPDVSYTLPETIAPETTALDAEIIAGIHVPTGFVEGDGLPLVIQNCTNCHAAALVTQNRMSREGWVATIRWMQETQNLWDLGENETAIVDYLATHYAPDQKGRRENLATTEWYQLKP